LAAKQGVEIDVNVSQLSAGVHGIHIHNVGKCEGPDFASAGPHLNPDTKKHGEDSPEGPHAGDLLNVEVKADGTAKATCTTQWLRWPTDPIPSFTMAEPQSLSTPKRTTTKPIQQGTPVLESPAALFRNRGSLRSLYFSTR
jgi:hypothetical protein